MPKKVAGLLFCLLLCACGTFKVQVQVLPEMTATLSAPVQPSQLTPTPEAQVSTSTATPNPAPSFSSDIRFSQEVGKPDARSFAPKILQVFASWDYANMRAGMNVRREWYLNGQLWLSREEAWDFAKYGANGTINDISIYDFETGLPSGNYQLRLFIDGQPQFVEGSASEKIAFAIQQAISPALVSISMSDNLRGWGLEQAGKILKTLDGGQTWQDLTPVGSASTTLSFFALNSEAAWAVPGAGVIWRTQDGGLTWKPSQPLELPAEGNYRVLSLVFPDAMHGWISFLAENAVSDPRFLLFRSEDGGESWKRVSSLENPALAAYLPDTKTSLTFFDGLSGWVGGWWGKDDPSRWFALKTTDGGNSWQVEALPVIPNLLAGQPTNCSGASLVGLHPAALAVDLTCTQGQRSLRRFYYLSQSTRQNWLSWELSSDVLGLDFLDTHVGWRLTTGQPNRLNELSQTLDGGRTWRKIAQASWKTAQFNFISSQVGWAIVGNGKTSVLIRTADGGKTWAVVNPVLKP